MSTRLASYIELILTIYEFLLVAEQLMLILSKNGEILSKIHEIVSLINISLNSSSDQFCKSITPKKRIIFAILVLFLGNISILFFTNLNNSLSSKGNKFIDIVSKLSYSPWASLLNFLFLLNLSNICISRIASVLNAEIFSYLSLNYLL